MTSLLFTVSDDDDDDNASDDDSNDDAGRPTASAFGYDIGSTQRELFGEGDESSSEGEWAELFGEVNDLKKLRLEKGS